MPKTDILTPSTFDTNSRGWWKFDQTLEDQISSNDFSEDNSATASYQQFTQFNLSNSRPQTKYGLLMESDKTYSTTVDGFGVPNNYRLNMGFFYFSPGVVGFMRHAVTKQLTTRLVPLIALADSTISGGEETISASAGEWIMSEVAHSETQNKIRVALCDGGGGDPSHIFESDAYTPGFIHVYVDLISDSVDDDYFYLRIDVNGKFGPQFVLDNPTATPVLQLSDTIAKLRLFDIGYGPTAHRLIQAGAYVSDLLIQAQGNVASQKTIMMMRYGPEFVLEEEANTTKFTYFGIGYDQPITVTTNQIFADGGNIFAARSDGELQKGNRPVWDNEFNYVDPNSLTSLSISETDEERTAKWTTEGLALKGTTVKI